MIMELFNCLSIYNEHDETVMCHCGIPKCKKCELHYFWKSNNRNNYPCSDDFKQRGY